MVQKDDWRLFGQEKFLKGVTLEWMRYRQYSPSWDHDHCSFCMARFQDSDEPDILREGYATLDEYYWICRNCFNDFKELFQWTVRNDWEVPQKI
jgi:hypothetical protein